MNCKDVKSSIDMASRRNPLEREAHAHISGCLECRSYSDQSSALLSLLTAQPRVEAPADFDFRLRARIARAQAEPVSSFGFLENFFGQAFSLKQAAASLAALAVMAAGTTLYFNQGSQPAQAPAIVAYNMPAASPKVDLPKPQVGVPSAYAASVKSSSASIRPAVLTATSVKQVPVSDNAVAARQQGVLIAANNSSVVYGAEKSASVNKSQEFIPSL